MPDTGTELRSFETGRTAAARPPTAGRRRRRRRPLLAGAGVLLAVLLALLWHLSAGPADPAAAHMTAAVRRGDIEDSTTALGSLQPVDYVDVGTQVSGQLEALHVEIGAEVEMGDLLAEIDPAVYLSRVEADRAQLANLEAQLADREAQLILARQQVIRQRNLMVARATSEDALQVAEAALRSAEAQVDAVKAQIRQTESTLRGDEANLGYTKIYAPMSGTVVSQSAQQGQTLNANQQAPIIVRIADLSTMTVQAQVSEADIGRLQLGMDAYFTTLGRPDRRWYGRLRQILPTPEVVNNVVLYNALFDVPNPTGELMTQMSAQVFFVSAAAEDVLLVPLAALEAVDAAAGLYRVRVVAGDGGIEEREVTVGVTNRIEAEIRSGLAEGERVVVGTRPPAAQPTGSGRGPRLS